MAGHREEDRPKWDPRMDAYVDRAPARAIGEEVPGVGGIHRHVPAEQPKVAMRYTVRDEGHQERVAEAGALATLLQEIGHRVATALQGYLGACEDVGRAVGAQEECHKRLLEAQRAYDEAASRFRDVAQVAEGWTPSQADPRRVAL